MNLKNLSSYRNGLISMVASLCFASVANAAYVPASYSVYSLEELTVMDRASVGGGIAGTNSTTNIGYEAIVEGHIFSVGNVSLKDHSTVIGTLKTNGIVLAGNDVSLGDVIQRASLPTYSIQTKTVTCGTANFDVSSDQTKTLAPGNYNNVTVYDRATLVLNAGIYNLNSLNIGHDCKLKLNFTATQTIQINVKSNFSYQDRSSIIFVNSTNPESVKIYSNQTSDCVLGIDTKLPANLTVPYAHVKAMDRARVSGQLLAKKVTFSNESSTTGTASSMEFDTDRDGVSDYAEVRIGTDPNNPLSKPSVPVSGSFVNNTINNNQALSVSVAHISGYSQTNVTCVYSKGDIVGDLLPILNIVPSTKADAPRQPIPGVGETYRSDGVGGAMYYDIEGEVSEGHKVYFAFPLSNDACGLPKEFVRLHHFNETTNDWEDVAIDKIVGNVAYAWVSSFSYYAADMFDHIMKVDKNFVLPDPNDSYKFTTIEDAFKAITTHSNYYKNPLLTDKTKAYDFAVFIRGGTGITYEENVNQNIPIKTSVIGGFADLGDIKTNWTYADPKANPVVVTPVGTTSGYMMMVDDPEADLVDVDVYIDGLTFKNIDAMTFEAPLVLKSSHHYRKVDVKNCIFTENTGASCAGIYLFNVSNVVIESCVFDRNVVTGTSYSGSAILASLYPTCGVGVDIRSCLFYGNQYVNTTPSTWTGSTITISNTGGTVANTRYVSIYNNTFFKNKSDFGPSCVNAMHPYSAGDFNDPLFVNNNIMYDNLSGSTTLHVFPAIFNDGSNYYADPKFTGSLIIPATSAFSAVGTFTNVGNTDLAIAKGADGVWGTPDDGLTLDKSSVCVNTSKYTEVPVDVSVPAGTKRTLVSERDASYRLRSGTTINSSALTSTTYKQDKGAYEYYTKVMCVGSDNSAGTDNDDNYQSYLKEYADAAGFPIDYVGPWASPQGLTAVGAGAISKLGGDPSVPQSEKLTTDQQGACKVGATVASLSSPNTIFDQIVNTKSDFTLVMVGDAEKGTLTLTSALTFATSLIKNNTVFLSNLVACMYGENQTFIEDYNKLSSFGTVVKAGDPNQVTVEGDKKALSDYVIEGKTITNVVSGAGFKFLAKTWWTSLVSHLPTAAVAPVATTDKANSLSLEDTDGNGSESITIKGTDVSGCTYSWVVDNVLSTNTTNTLTTTLDVNTLPHSVQFVVTNSTSGLRSAYNMLITINAQVTPAP